MKRIIRLTLITLLFTILNNCESGQNNQFKNYTYNQSINKENKNRVNIEKDSNDIDTIPKPIVIEKNLLNIGLLLPLSGAHYHIGTSLLNSAQLALEKTGDNNIVFHVADMGDPNKALKNFYSILENDLDLIIGPVFTHNIEIVKNVLKEKKIPTITLSNNSLMEEENIYIFGLTIRDEIKEIMRYSKKNNFKNFVIILPDGEFGKTIKNEIMNFHSVNSSMSFRFVYYDTESPDFYSVSKAVSRYEERKINLEKQIQRMELLNTDIARKEIKQLKKLDTYGELDFDALIIFATKFSEISNLSSILPYYDVDPKKIQYISNSILGKDIALKEPGLENAYFSSLDIDKKKMFEEDYLILFNRKPHRLSSLSYDVVGLISKVNLNTDNINNIFNTEAGFIGINGWFKFTTDGRVIRKPNIYKIKREKFIKIN